NERQPNAGVARGGFDKRHARLEHTASFRVVHDGECDAILDAATGVEKLALAIDGYGEAGRDSVEAHKGRVTDPVEDARVGHARIVDGETDAVHCVLRSRFILVPNWY